MIKINKNYDSIQPRTSSRSNQAGNCTRSGNWGLIPPLGDIEAYIKAVNAMPLLTLEQEQSDGAAVRDLQDAEASGRMIMSHLRLVVSMARHFSGYGLPFDELIQEGNVGLMKAVKRFDPAQGFRLVSYAMHWIRAEISEYVLKNHRVVRMATTKSHRKLFFNLRSLTRQIRTIDAPEAMHRSSLTPEETLKIATMLNVKPEDVLDMEGRLAGADIALDGYVDDGGMEYGPLDHLEDPMQSIDVKIEARQKDWLSQKGLSDALGSLDARSRRIVSARWLDVLDNGSGGATLGDLATEYGVSAERIRQIETRALKTMKASLEKAMESTFLPV